MERGGAGCAHVAGSQALQPHSGMRRAVAGPRARHTHTSLCVSAFCMDSRASRCCCPEERPACARTCMRACMHVRARACARRRTRHVDHVGRQAVDHWDGALAVHQDADGLAVKAGVSAAARLDVAEGHVPAGGSGGRGAARSVSCCVHAYVYCMDASVRSCYCYQGQASPPCPCPGAGPLVAVAAKECTVALCMAYGAGPSPPARPPAAHRTRYSPSVTPCHAGQS